MHLQLQRQWPALHELPLHLAHGTLDLGADKADRTGLTLSNEENPALGLRGVRLSLARPKVADTQLRAILRASAYGKLRVLGEDGV